MGRLRKRWIDTVKECLRKTEVWMSGEVGEWCRIGMKEYLRKRGLDVRQATRIVQDRSEWREFVMGNAWGVAREMNP